MSSIRNGHRLALLAGAALLIQSGTALAQDQTTNVTFADSVTANSPAGSTHTVNITDLVGQSSNITGVVIAGQGAGRVVINNSGNIHGRLNFTNLSGGVDLNLDLRWASAGNSVFGAGNDEVVVGEDGELLLGMIGGLGTSPVNAGDHLALETPAILDFGAGVDDRLVNNGIMMVGPKYSGDFSRYLIQEHLEAEVRLINLETFENSGRIFLGGSATPRDAQQGGTVFLDAETDYVNDDVLLMPGTHFVGLEGSRIILDAILTADQSACDVSLRNTETYYWNDLRGEGQHMSGEMPAADCVSIEGGSTEGETQILINQIGAGDRGGPVSMVLVDVSGGESASGHFVLDPANRNYNPEQGGFLDLGYFIMPLVYDPDTQQHVLLGVTGQNAWQTTNWAAAVHDVWRVSTGSWFSRQADLRGDVPEGVGGGIWMRAVGDLAERDVEDIQQAGATTFVFDNSYEQQTYAITGGVDVMTGSGADSAWVVGLMAGYANSELTYRSSPNRTQFDSWTGGAYASFLSGGLFVDATINANKSDVKSDMPALNMFPVGTILDTELLTVGAQVEAGWRIPIAEAVFIEPLAGVSWVRTTWDDLPIPSADPLREGVEVEFGDPESLRANIGARVGIDQDYGAFRAQYSVIGRVWNEFEGEHTITLHSIAEDVSLSDEFTGAMTELSFGAGIYGQVVSGFLNLGGRWADDYQSYSGTMGVRVAF